MAEKKKTNELLIYKVLGKRADNLTIEEMTLLDGLSDFMVEMFIDYLQQKKGAYSTNQ
ncbi:hypothetical protein SDC9_137959 [bioreactor metagenome]|uniref:Uncharacterized protein n=1 Tax=bioreactor metagenome TaxID=1076179 RepID=A0A645DNH4_9ZZZZ